MTQEQKATMVYSCNHVFLQAGKMGRVPQVRSLYPVWIRRAYRGLSWVAQATEVTSNRMRGWPGLGKRDSGSRSG